MTAQQSLILSRDDVMAIALTLLQDPRSAAPVILYGPPGTGKTSMAFEIARLLGSPLYKVACNPDGTAADVIGGMSPDPAGTGGWVPFAPGPAALAWGYNGAPGLLLLDDIHEAGPGYTAAMYTALDAGPGGAITLPTGKLLTPDPRYRVICTSNGDETALHPAVWSRMSHRYQVLRPSQAMIDSLSIEIRTFVEIDYDGRNATQVADFREWRTMDTVWHTLKQAGTPGPDALARACLIALGTMERAHAMLEILQTAKDKNTGLPLIPDAVQAVLRVLSGMPSGAPR